MPFQGEARNELYQTMYWHLDINLASVLRSELY